MRKTWIFLLFWGLNMIKNFGRLLPIIPLLFFSSESYAEKNWRLLAGLEEDFRLDPTMTLNAGQLVPDSDVGEKEYALGIEFSFDCVLIQPKKNKLRQQLSYLRYKDGDSTLQTIQLNPHYLIELLPNFWIGGGPGLAYVRADVNNKKSNMLAGQLGASLHYKYKRIFLGAETRYQLTQNDDVGKGKDNGASSWQTLLKLGYNFY